MTVAATAPTMAATIVGPANDSSGSQQSPSSTEGKGEPSLPSWLPEMADIRAAHLAQASALESVVATLASKQQSSIVTLKRQMDAMALAQRRVLHTAEQQAVAANVARFANIGQKDDSGGAINATGGDVGGDETVGAESALAMIEAADTKLEVDNIEPAPSWDTLDDYQPFQQNKEQQLQQGATHPH